MIDNIVETCDLHVNIRGVKYHIYKKYVRPSGKIAFLLGQTEQGGIAIHRTISPHEIMARENK